MRFTTPSGAVHSAEVAAGADPTGRRAIVTGALIKQALEAGINFFDTANSTRASPAKRSSAGRARLREARRL